MCGNAQGYNQRKTLPDELTLDMPITIAAPRSGLARLIVVVFGTTFDIIHNQNALQGGW
jgi:hypothetical protein